MSIVYEGVAGYIATTAEGDNVIDLEFNIPVGRLLVIVSSQSTGHEPEPYPNLVTPFLWGTIGNRNFVYGVSDTGSNSWGYAMDGNGEGVCGRLPMMIVTTPLVAGDDTITVTIEQDRENPSHLFQFVARILCFSGISAFDPPNGLPVAMNYPIFNVPYNEFDGFFTLDPDDAIPLPRLVGIPRGPVQQTPAYEYSETANTVSTDGNYTSAFGVTGPCLFLASIGWDGTENPWDYYFTSGKNDPGGSPVVATSPSPYGLSSDNGTWDFAAVDPDPGWVDLGADTGAAYESRYAYLVYPNPPPDTTEIGASYDAAGGTWSDSDDQGSGSPYYPYEGGSYSPPPTWPLGDPNIIASPVRATTWIMEGIAAGGGAGAGIYASVARGGATTGTGTLDPDTMIGISHVRKRGGAL